MNEHLTQEQLAYYSANRLKGEEENIIGSHLIQCEDCRNRMPMPTVEQFLTVLFGVGDEDSEYTEKDIEQMAADWRKRLRD